MRPDPLETAIAIEAAAKAHYALDPTDDPGGCQGSPPMSWDELPLMVQQQLLDEMGTAVRAAAPHIERAALLRAAEEIARHAAELQDRAEAKAGMEFAALLVEARAEAVGTEER